MEAPASFLETIRLEDGKFHFLSYHQNRLDRTRKKFCGSEKPLSLAKSLQIPMAYKRGLFKVRVVYDCDIKKVTYHPYQVRPVKTLRLMTADHIDYDFKYTDRTAINNLFEQKGTCDDILMVRKGLLTDSSYANIILSDGQYWYTPANPIMAGTCRARLLEMGKIIPADIYEEHLQDFQEIRLINAMMSFDEGPRIPVGQVRKVC